MCASTSPRPLAIISAHLDGELLPIKAHCSMYLHSSTVEFQLLLVYSLYASSSSSFQPQSQAAAVAATCAGES